LLCRSLITPRLGERCFVPHSVWPDEAPVHTPHGIGWLATVTALSPRTVHFVCDHEDEPVAMQRASFRQHCGLVGALPSPQGVWEWLDEDSLTAVLRACDMMTLLALEASHRGAQLVVRAFWQREPWVHRQLPGVSYDACCLVTDGDLIVAGAGRVGRVRGGPQEAPACAWMVWASGERVARVETQTAVVAVAANAASGRVAVAHTRVEVYRLMGSPTSCLAQPCATYERPAVALAWFRGALVASAGCGSVTRLPEDCTIDSWQDRVTSLAAATPRVVVGYDNGAVRCVWPRPAVMLRRSIRAPTLAVAASDDGTIAATRARAVDLWQNTAYLRTICTSGRPSALHLLPGCMLLVGAGSRGRIELWTAGRRVGVLEGHAGAVTGIGVDARGHVVSASVTPTPGERTLWCSRPPARLI
jgi:hypothetical protein